VRYEVLTLGSAHEGVVRTIELSGEPLGRREAAELVAAAESLVEDRSVRAVVLGTAGANFCPGPAEDLDPLAFGLDPAAALARLRPPVVAAVKGRCLSVGLELALAADIRLTDPGARFGLPDLAEGRLPCWGGTQRLPRAIGVARATALVLLGETMTALEAHAAGLVAGVAAPGGLAAAVDATVEQLLGVGPLALELGKEAVHRGSELPLRDGLRLEGDLNHLLQATDDRAEGLAAFFAKRPPDFAGR
jgi:enoyl-CoA hydratase/carnithine racemase